MCLFFLQLGPNQVLDDVLTNLDYNANVKENNVTSFCGQWCRRKKSTKDLIVHCDYWRIVRLSFILDKCCPGSIFCDVFQIKSYKIR